jgi:cellobiose phosphorylase
MSKLYSNKYGYFDAERNEYVITRPDTPKPWVNIISTGAYGFTISQAGSGYSWRDHAQFNRITRWDQDLTRDNWGKYIYIRDEDSGRFWSPTPKPAGSELKNFSCRHGTGYTVISGVCREIESELRLFADMDAPVEVWELKLKNTSGKRRKLSLFTYLEWCLGVSPDWHREFDKIFITTEFEKKTGIFWATKTRWGLPDPSGRPWARPYEFVGFHATFPKAESFDSDQREFLGVLGENGCPKAVRAGRLSKLQGRCNDGVASLQSSIVLKPGESKTVVYLMGATRTREEARKIVTRYSAKGAAEKAVRKVQDYWRGLLGELEVKTPDPSVDLLVNQWLPYQAISCRMFGRTAYYQTGGAYGYRDQLQDSQATLPLDAKLCREHLERAARHQFSDGTTFHWWHPITEDGQKKKNSDDLLWLPFVMTRYIQETGDTAFLEKKVPFFDKGGATMREHCRAAIEQVLARPNPRGIPTMVEGDWNDGLSCIGFDGVSESIWLGEFLYGILTDWCEVLDLIDDAEARRNAARYRKAAEKVKKAINKHAWDGDWYIRATYSKGVLGSQKSRIGKIWLNAQTWALMYDMAPAARKAKILKALNKHLYREFGPLLFHPAFSKPDPAIGHISQYAPGLRENGGLYTHAGCWAIIAEALAGTPERAFKVFNSFNPIRRGAKPDHYLAEPYVTPGNVDGPQSPNFGRGGWTWYSGSAAWMYRSLTDYILGVRATTRGLLIQPAIPAAWKGFSMKRRFRGATYRIEVANKSRKSAGRKVQITVNGKALRGNVLPIAKKGSVVNVRVTIESE